MGGKRLGGVADHRLAGKEEELLRRVRAEAAAGTGGDKNEGDAHGP